MNSLADSQSTSRFDVAVFPLFDTVLLPGAMLPLDMLAGEERWKVEDLQSRNLPVAISLITVSSGEAEGEAEYHLNTICGAGTIQVAKPLIESAVPVGGRKKRRKKKTGDSDEGSIIVFGERRIRLCEVVQEHPYLVMEAEELKSEEESDSEVTLPPDLEGFRALVKSWAFLNPKVPDEICPIFDEYAGFNELTDFFVFYFLQNAEQKQAYLDCTSAIRRALMLEDQLTQDLARFSRKIERQKQGILFH